MLPLVFMDDPDLSPDRRVKFQQTTQMKRGIDYVVEISLTKKKLHIVCARGKDKHFKMEFPKK